MIYTEFIKSKRPRLVASGFDADVSDVSLFPFQRDIVKWALRQGKAAVFADTGLGKTRMQLAWAKNVSEYTGENVLILAPLAVATQTIAEGKRIGIEAHYHRSQDGVDSPITITNYEMMEAFDANQFVGVVLDESSRSGEVHRILKKCRGGTKA